MLRSGHPRTRSDLQRLQLPHLHCPLIRRQRPPGQSALQNLPSGLGSFQGKVCQTAAKGPPPSLRVDFHLWAGVGLRTQHTFSTRTRAAWGSGSGRARGDSEPEEAAGAVHTQEGQTGCLTLHLDTFRLAEGTVPPNGLHERPGLHTVCRPGLHHLQVHGKDPGPHHFDMFL